MANVFISYAKQDFELALKLSAQLEAHGMATLWDADPAGVQRPRDEIMNKLTAANAVVVIWTAHSVGSDWVRAEAGRARQHGKLVALKTDDIEISAVPAPFGEMPMLAPDDDAKVIDAVRRKITPAANAPAYSRLLSHDALTVLSVIGTAITLLTNLKGIIEVAGWLRVVIQNWTHLMTTAWSYIFFYVPKLEPSDALLLTVLVFMLGSFLVFQPEKYNSIFSRDLWLKRIDMPFADKVLMVVPMLFCLFVFALGYLDILGVLKSDFLLGRTSLGQESVSDRGVISHYLLEYLLIPAPGNLQIAQIMILCCAIPIILITVIATVRRQKIDFVKASRRAAGISLIFMVLTALNYLALWWELGEGLLS